MYLNFGSSPMIPMAIGIIGSGDSLVFVVLDFYSGSRELRIRLSAHPPLATPSLVVKHSSYRFSP